MSSSSSYTVYGDRTRNAKDNAPSQASLARHPFYLYLITNEVTGTIYVGQHRSNLNEDWRHYMGSGSYLNTEAKGYGVHNFSKKLLAWADDGLEAKFLEGRFISKALLKSVYCYNSNNSESVNRDPKNNGRHFAFKASFRGRQRILHNIALVDKHAGSATGHEVFELAKLKNAWNMALRIKQERFEATRQLDPKDTAEDKYGFNPNDSRD